MPLLVLNVTSRRLGGVTNCAQTSFVGGVDRSPKDNRSCIDGAVR